MKKFNINDKELATTDFIRALLKSGYEIASVGELTALFLVSLYLIEQGEV